MSEERGQVEDVHIRLLLSRDAPAVALILRESSGAAAWSTEALENSLENKGTLALVCEQGSELLGAIVGGRVGDEAEILNLAVKLSRRRQGLGRMLVEKIVAGWEGFGVTRIFLEVRESNIGAIAFYDGMGFRRVGRRLKYYSAPEEDALVLARGTIGGFHAG